MYMHIYNSLVDIEQRIQEVLADIRIVKEQSFYTYEADETSRDDSEEQQETERLAAFDHLAKQDT